MSISKSNQAKCNVNPIVAINIIINSIISMIFTAFALINNLFAADYWEYQSAIVTIVLKIKGVMKLISVTIKSDIVIINLKGWSLINHCHDCLFRMIELVGQKVMAAALIVGLSLGFGFLPAVLAKKYLQHSQKRICSTHKKGFAGLTKKYWRHIKKHYTPSQSFGT